MTRHTPPTDPDATAGALTIAGVTVRIERTPSRPVKVAIDTRAPDHDDPVDLEILFDEAKIFEHWRWGAESITPEGATSGGLTVGGVTVGIAWDSVRDATVLINPGVGEDDSFDLYFRGEMIFEGLRWDEELLTMPPVVSHGTAPGKAAAEHGLRRIRGWFRRR